MWAPVLTAALGAAQWFVENKRQQQAREAVPVQLLTDGYFEAMAEDIHVRVAAGQDLQHALREIYTEQGPVLLQPAPDRSPGKGWVVVASLAAAAVLGLMYARRREQL